MLRKTNDLHRAYCPVSCIRTYLNTNGQNKLYWSLCAKKKELCRTWNTTRNFSSSLCSRTIQFCFWHLSISWEIQFSKILQKKGKKKLLKLAGSGCRVWTGRYDLQGVPLSLPNQSLYLGKKYETSCQRIISGIIYVCFNLKTSSPIKLNMSLCHMYF